MAYNNNLRQERERSICFENAWRRFDEDVGWKLYSAIYRNGGLPV